MSVTRADLLTYVQGEHSALLAEAGIATTDTQAGLKSVLDKAFRALGVAQSDLATATTADANAEKVEAAADYYTYDRLAASVFALWTAVSKGAGGASVSKDRSKIYQQVSAERDRKALICANLGLVVEPPDLTAFTINLDFLEPVPSV